MFSRSELAAMRDRTRSRRYCALNEEFRREHARHRDWGLAQRHAEKLRRNRAAAEAAAAHEPAGPPQCALFGSRR